MTELRLEIFRQCPLGCRHCYQGHRTDTSDAPSALLADDARFDALLGQFVDLGGKSVSLSGGEMLLAKRWPRLRALLSTLVQRGITDIRINTTLAHAPITMIDELARLPIEKLRVQTGVDGPSVHDFLRFGGSLARTLEVCRMLRARGVSRLTARTTLFFGQHVEGRELWNLDDLDWILKAAADAGISRLKTKVLHPSGLLVPEAREAAALWDARADSVVAPALARLVSARLTHQTPLRLLFTNPVPRTFVPCVLDAQRADPDGVQLEQCACGASHLAIDVDGLVYRCLYNFGKPELALGSVLRSSLQEIVADSARLSYVTHGEAGACGAFDDNLRRAATDVATIREDPRRTPAG